jgi:tetratricopeptide (TPR) repeat protein
MRFLGLSFLLIVFAGGSIGPSAIAQSGGHILYGDVKVDESKATGFIPISYDLILYNLSGNVIARQTVTSNGRYRFMNLTDGHYDLVVESENTEVARIRVELSSPRVATDYRQDIFLELKPPVGAPSKPSSVSVEDYYKRSSANRKLFEKAQAATNKKRYGEAISLLRELLTNDPKDFQAWTELGTVHLIDQNLTEAEQAYARAIEIRPKFFLALMNLGRLRFMRKNFNGAISALSTALAVKPTSADANYYLGEAYLQVKKGSKAVGYLNEAIKLDPVGKADAHLRLATLYNAVGLKDKAAAEYQAFLKKKPDYPNKKRLEQYIAQNKKS